MFILDVQPEQHREVPVLMSQAERCAGDRCRNARPNPVALKLNAALVTDVVMQDLTPRQSQGDAQSLIDYTQTLIEGEELMFIMDVPVMPAQEMPIVLVQAAAPAAGATPQPDYILQTCGETVSTGVQAVDPAGMLAVYMQNHNNRTVSMEMLAAIKTNLLKGATVGKITSGIDNTGRSWYSYDAPSNYVGNDQAIFQAEFEGKRYRIVLELHVFEGPATPGDFGAPTCPEPTLIKVTKPSTGASGYGSGYNLSSITVTFADLAGAAIGQTNATGITLDTNASGYNWYIDTTPGSNEEFLPTSNPNEWVAKAGSAAAGKMDMK